MNALFIIYWLKPLSVCLYSEWWHHCEHAICQKLSDFIDRQTGFHQQHNSKICIVWDYGNLRDKSWNRSILLVFDSTQVEAAVMRPLGQQYGCQSGQAPKHPILFKHVLSTFNEVIWYHSAAQGGIWMKMITDQRWTKIFQHQLFECEFEVRQAEGVGWSMATAAVRSTSCLLGR